MSAWPGRAGDREAFESSSKRSAPSCMPTATGCSARCTTPMTRCRNAAARVARAAALPRPELAAHVAVPDRHQRLHGRARAAPEAGAAGRLRHRPMAADGDVGERPLPAGVDRAVPGRGVRRCRRRRRARGPLRATRGARAGVRGGAAAPAAAPAGRADPARRARFLGAGGRRGARARPSRRSTARCAAHAPRSPSGCRTRVNRSRCARSAIAGCERSWSASPIRSSAATSTRSSRC